MYRRILVPLDTSDLAASALPTARALAARSGADVHLVHVLQDLLDFPEEVPRDDIAGEQRMRSAVSDYLKQQAQAVEEDEETGVVTDVIRHAGPTAEALQAYADDHGIDLVVMTTHGEGGVRRLWLGSVADGLLRRASVPLLLLRPDDGTTGLAEERCEEVLVPLDGSPESEAVLTHAVAMAESLDATLRLLRVVPPGRGLEGFRADPASAEREGLTEGARRQATDYLEGVADTLRRRSEREVVVKIEVAGDEHPADGILDRAEVESVGLVALATHGRGGFKRMVLGSVADKIVRGGTTPVLAVPMSTEG